MATVSASTIAKPTGAQQSPPPYFGGTCVIRVKSAKFGNSAGGNPMITLLAEIVSPADAKSDLDGLTYQLAGQELNYYLMLNTKDSKGQESKNLYKFVTEFLPMAGLPSEFDDADPLATLKFEGLCFEALVKTQQRKERVKRPDGSYKNLTDAQGNEITKGWEFSSQTSDILRRAETTEGAPY